MGAPFNKRIVRAERRITALETQLGEVQRRQIKLDQALEKFWKGIPYEQRLEIIEEVEGTDDQRDMDSEE